MRKVFIIGGLRTPIVTAGTKFRNIRPEIFGAEVLKNLRGKFKLRRVDEIICGNAVGTGGNIARLMTLCAGFDDSIAALTVDRQCAGGASAIVVAYSKIACGLCDCVIAGGIESASLQPLRVYNKNDARYKLTTADGIQGGYYTAQFSPEETDSAAMLRGAERVAKAEGITKAELDAWAIESHRRAANAIEILRGDIVEINGVNRDTGVKPNITQKLLDRVPLPLGVGTVTSAGNSCRINDGAAFVVMASENFVRENDLTPKARFIDATSGGVNPLESPRGAMAIADKLLRRNNLTYENISAIEFNEAFAVIDVLFEREHPKLTKIYNRFGGALAYGHPYGASGAVLMLNLLHNLEGVGLMSIAGAGGTGEAILIDNELL